MIKTRCKVSLVERITRTKKHLKYLRKIKSRRPEILKEAIVYWKERLAEYERKVELEVTNEHV